MKKTTLLISFLLILLGQAVCQLRIGEFMTYSNNNGLPASLYYAVYQSSDGYLWMGSSSGLVRFDGKRYTIFFSDYADSTTISDNIIVDMVEDDNQHLWIAGYYQGLSTYNLKTGRIKRYSKLSKDPTPGYGINKLLKNKEGLWIATAGRGLAHYLPDQDSFELFIPNPMMPFDGSDRYANHVTDIAIDKSDADILWLSTFDGLYAFNQRQKSFKRFVFNTPEVKNQPLAFLAIETDQSDHIYLGTWYNGLISFHTGTKIFETHSSPQAEPPYSSHYQVIDILSRDDSTLYLASRNLGLLSFHKETHKMESLISNDMLPGRSSDIDIQRVTKTPDAGIFVGGNYYIYQQHTSFDRFSHAVTFSTDRNAGIQKIIYDERRKGYWLGFLNTGNLVFLENNMASKQFFYVDGQSEFQCIDLAIDRNQQVWAVSPFSGLLKLAEKTNSFRRVGIEMPELGTQTSAITAIESDHEGNIWILNRNNLFYFNVESNHIQRFNILPETQGTLNNITMCAGRHDDAWVASDKGLFHFIRGENKTVRLIPRDEKRKSIANVAIKAMTIDRKGNAWIGFESDGVQVVGYKEHEIMTSYNLHNGLPGMQINYMETDSSGRIWVGTSAGLALFNPNAESGIWQLFNREDGIKRDYIDRPIMATSDGKLFFNIENGISWIDINAEPTTPEYTPVLHITTFTVDGIPHREGLMPDYYRDVNLSYRSKEIRIEFAAMDWLHPSRTKYFYRIEGINAKDEWIENSQAIILLTGMKPGNYVLQLYAVNGDGIKTNEINLPVSISPPFWQRWWFVSLVVLVFLSFAYAIYRYRIGQLQKIQLMRNTISTNLHDDIGASLSNIHILTVLTQRNLSNHANASSYIAKAGDEIQRISESLSDIVWNISPRYDDLDNLFVRMKRYAADMLEGKEINAELIFPQHAEKISLPMDQRRDFYLIFKEAINNLVKYSQSKEAFIQVTVEHHLLRMEIRDHGHGFDQSIVSTGNGIQNMKQRAEKWGAQLSVNSAVGEGTRIILEMKVK